MAGEPRRGQRRRRGLLCQIVPPANTLQKHIPICSSQPEHAPGIRELSFGSSFRSEALRVDAPTRGRIPLRPGAYAARSAPQLPARTPLTSKERTRPFWASHASQTKPRKEPHAHLVGRPCRRWTRLSTRQQWHSNCGALHRRSPVCVALVRDIGIDVNHEEIETREGGICLELRLSAAAKLSAPIEDAAPTRSEMRSSWALAAEQRE